MRKKGIIICDSGIPEAFSGQVKSIDIGMGIYDDNGHGSTIVNLLNHLDPTTNIISIKMLDKNKSSNLGVLIQALIACKQCEEQIISLSLSIDDIQNSIELKETIDDLVDSGKIIVASKHNRQLRSIPSCYPNVIGVESHEGQPFFIFDAKDDVQCKIKRNVVFVKDHKAQYTAMTGNSLLAPIVALMLDHMLKESGETILADVCNQLNFNAEVPIIEAFFVMPENRCQDGFEKIKIQLLKIMDRFNIQMKENMLLNNFNKNSFSDFLIAIEESGLSINKNHILKLCDLDSFDNFLSYIYFNQIKQE